MSASSGLRSPRCVARVSQMQTNPRQRRSVVLAAGKSQPPSSWTLMWDPPSHLPPNSQLDPNKAVKGNGRSVLLEVRERGSKVCPTTYKPCDLQKVASSPNLTMGIEQGVDDLPRQVVEDTQ